MAMMGGVDVSGWPVGMTAHRQPSRRALIAMVAGLLALIAWLATQIGNDLPAEIVAASPDVTSSSTAAAAPPGPYLTDIAGKPRAGTYFEGRRLVAGYKGPAARYRRSCDNATIDIGFLPGSDNLDIARLEAWRTTAPCNIYASLSLVQTYDQDGTHKPLAAVDTASEDRTEPFRAWQGRLGSLHMAGQGAAVPLAGNDTAFSALVAGQLMASAEVSSLWSLVGQQAGTEAALYMPGTIAPAYRSGGAADIDRFWQDNPTVAIRANPTVIGWTGAPDARTLFARGNAVSHKGRFAPMATSYFRLAASSLPPRGGWARFGVVLWTATLSVDEMQAAIAAVNRAMAFPSHFDAMVVARGDSILYGAGTEGTDQRGYGWFLSKALPTVELFNLGVKGQQLADQVQPGGGAGSVTALLSSSPYGPSKTVALWTSGINDLGSGRGPPGGNNGRSANDVIADFNSAMRLSRTALAGVRTMGTTLLPRTDSEWFATRAHDGMVKEDARKAVNAALLGGRSGADLIVDIADPRTTMGAPGATDDRGPYDAPDIGRSGDLYVDKLHPSSTGYASGLWQSVAAGLKRLLGE